MPNLAALIRKWLAAAGITQTELARRIGTTPQHVSGILSGRRDHVRSDTLLAIIAATGHEIAKK